MEGNVDAATLRLTIKEIAEIERKKERKGAGVSPGLMKEAKMKIGFINEVRRIFATGCKSSAELHPRV